MGRICNVLQGAIMREITTHIVPGDSTNHQLTVAVTDEPGQGGACHSYLVSGFNTGNNPGRGEDGVTLIEPTTMLHILFQNGPIKDVGVNGITHEAFLAILIDRMEDFQRGPYSNLNNAKALGHLMMALKSFQDRTRERMARGVEGTHEK